MLAERYIELNSMLFDLYSYIPYLNHQDKEQIVSHLEQISLQQQDDVRRARSQINIHKLKKVFSFYTFHDDHVKTSQIVKSLHQDYQKYLDLDGKPEKGERKLADDLVLVINSILKPYFHKKLDHFVLYRIGLLEFALELSPYNFDIQLALLKIYDALGYSISFNQSFIALGCKGVQLESLGYLVLRHTLDWGDFNIFKQFTQKFLKYNKLNMRDLKNLKNRALRENNYDQIENFIEYETFNQNSYFNACVKFTQILIEFNENLQQENHIQSYFQNMHQTLLEENKEVLDQSSQRFKERTQDLKIMMDLFQDIPHFYEFRKADKKWLAEFVKDDYLKEITRKDKIYSYYKFDRKSNYKTQMINTLGILEHQQSFALLHSILTSISQFVNNQKKEEKKIDIQQAIQNLRIQFEIYQKTVSEEDILWRNDSVGWNEQHKDLQIIAQLLIEILEISSNLLVIDKSEGKTLDDVANQILSLKEQILNMIQGFQSFTLSFQHPQPNEESKLDDLVPEIMSDQIKNRFQLILSFGSLFIPILEIFVNQLKSALPQKKKKKGKDTAQSESLDKVNAEIVSPVKQWVKDLQQFFTTQIQIQSQNIEVQRKTFLQQESEKIECLDQSLDKDQKIQQIINRKIEESIKEEKILRDRIKDLSSNIGKRLKEQTV